MAEASQLTAEQDRFAREMFNNYLHVAEGLIRQWHEPTDLVAMTSINADKLPGYDEFHQLDAKMQYHLFINAFAGNAMTRITLNELRKAMGEVGMADVVAPETWDMGLVKKENNRDG